MPASGYAKFPIVDYCYNSFSQEEKDKLQNDWEIVSSHLQQVYHDYQDAEKRNEQLVGFTHLLRPNLLLIELVPGFKRTATGSYQKPRYRLKQTFVDYIVRGHFDKSRAKNEIVLKESFSSFAQLDARCHALTLKYKGKTLPELREMLGIDAKVKDISAKCVIRMFGTDCNRLNQISDFNKAGIIAKTITITPQGGRTEDMKLKHIDFGQIEMQTLKIPMYTITSVSTVSSALSSVSMIVKTRARPFLKVLNALLLMKNSSRMKFGVPGRIPEI